MTGPGAAHTGLVSNSEFANERAAVHRRHGILTSAGFLSVRVERLVIPLRSDRSASLSFPETSVFLLQPVTQSFERRIR
jgi:hypothetical protein